MTSMTNEQKAAVNFPDTLCLTSCPGSGKTHTIIAKLKKCIDEIRGTPRRIACITFTNAAVNEIESRLKKYGDNGDIELCEVSTIHSFCLNNILRPFAHLIPHLKEGWSVTTSDDEWFSTLVMSLCIKYGIKPGLIERFGDLQRKFPNTLPVVAGLPNAAIHEFFQDADRNGKVTLGDIVFFSAKLVTENPFIASALASRFAWFIVDEFQDTTIAQSTILYELYKLGRSKLFFVGDPNQSILGFAGGAANLMEEFAEQVNADTSHHLTGNFRSSSHIVRHAELLCPATPNMVAVGVDKDFHVPPKHVQCATPIEGIYDHFLPALDQFSIPLGRAAVLAPWWTDLFQLGRELRNRDIPIIGPGSRPYKRSRDFALLSEALSAYLMSPNMDAAAVIQKAMFITISNITDFRYRDIYRYNGRRIMFRLILAAKEVLAKHEGLREWLLTLADVCEDILIEEELLAPGHKSLFLKSANAMLTDIAKNRLDVSNMAAVDLGMIAVPDDCMSLITMHQSKGREFDAVAIISLHEGRVPHFEATTTAQEDEARRLLYVSTTRAKKLLMYFTDQSDFRNRPSRFLKSPYLSLC